MKKASPVLFGRVVPSPLLSSSSLNLEHHISLSAKGRSLLICSGLTKQRQPPLKSCLLLIVYPHSLLLKPSAPNLQHCLSLPS